MLEKSTGDEKLRGVLAYFLGPVTGIVLLLVEKKNAFIRFHAMQSTIFLGSYLLLTQFVFNIVPVVGPILSFFFSPVISLIVFLLWIFLMWKAYSGEKYKLPYIGDLAEKQLEKIK